jgi:hypothetical protein
MHHVNMTGPEGFFFDQDKSIEKLLDGTLFAETNYQPLSLVSAADVMQLCVLSTGLLLELT